MAELHQVSDDRNDKAHADIGLVCALSLELSDFLAKCTHVKTYSGGKFTFRGGKFGSIRIVIVESGPGPERARRATLALLNAHTPQWVISTGFCGALQPELKIGGIVVSNSLTTLEGNELNIDVGMQTDIARGIHVGKTLTIPHIVRTVAEKHELAAQTNAIAVDMESHSVALVCRDQKTRFMSVRAVSDDMTADLPKEVLSVVGESGAVRIGAVIGALWKRPSSYKDMLKLRDHAGVAATNLATFLGGVVRQLHATAEK